ncbi:SRPBCC domain-containing protein [Nocardiopsis sp. HUAS JQ3]|uniref:SRPBCC domain-containing protein n=1 Tax=Nocardiopsis sp. HUAS JQ3 TaxID=3061629 RepID=UPI0023A9AFE9|nr:SRPBCC domain-containing protein [Nocardiopsis sp. HUAS JQ3]WDZ93136.1 SRPBCC domain-containing protein [Nocardiopsis sp. HUAS JQ3]
MTSRAPRTDRGSRTVRASAAAVYAAMTEPDALAAWLPPEGMAGRIDRFEPWPGGGYRMVLTYLDPQEGRGKTSETEDVTEVAFAELAPGERVVQRIGFESPDPDFAGTMTMTWTLAAAPEGTLVTVEAADVPRGIDHAVHEEALASSLANLAAHVER